MLTPEVAEQVATLLRQARNAHHLYRQSIPHIRLHNGQRQAVPGDPVQATNALNAARSRRADAHALDPGHESSAWTAETTDHDALMAFYQDQLAR